MSNLPPGAGRDLAYKHSIEEAFHTEVEKLMEKYPELTEDDAAELVSEGVKSHQVVLKEEDAERPDSDE